MKDRLEYMEKIDDLIDTVLEIRTDIMMNSLIEKAHTWQISEFDEGVVDRYKSRVVELLEERQSKLSKVTDELTDMCCEIAREEQEKEESEKGRETVSAPAV